MAITTYAELQTAITAFMIRNDLSAQAADWITLAEGELNSEIPAVETDAALVAVVGSRDVSVASLSIVSPIALFLKDNGNEREVSPLADGNFPYSDTSGPPSVWAMDGTNLNFDCPADQAYSLRLRYQQRFALSDASPTNWLLTNRPDVYLSASIVWGCLYTDNFDAGGNWKQMLASGMAQVKNQLRRGRKSVLRVDPALLQPRRFDGTIGL